MYDYIIIGAGSAGCVLANRLTADEGNRVLLLEAGKRDSSTFIRMPAGLAQLIGGGPYNWSFSTAPEPHLNNRQLFWPRGKVLGGSSSINGMVYIRGHAQDYDRWRQLGNEGWSYDDVLPYFKRSVNNERGANDFHGVGGPLNIKDGSSSLETHRHFVEAALEAGYSHNPDFNGAEQEGVGSFQLTKLGNERCSAATAFLKPALARDNLTVVTEARTLRVDMEGKRAKGVTYLRGDHEVQAVAAKDVILSAGAVQSPQLLQLSGIGSPRSLGECGIECLHELPGVGQNLQDHLDINVQYYCKDPRMSLARHTSLPAMVLALIRYMTSGGGPAAENPLEAGGFIKSRDDLDAPDLQLHFIPVFMVNHGRTRVNSPGLSIHVCQLRPESRGEIVLRSSDPLADPVIRPNYLSVESDLDVLVQGVRAARKIFCAERFRPFLGDEFEASRGAESDDDIKGFIRQHAETIYHPIGTCRMGHDDMAVVDARLRVRGIQSLRVVDASVMPTLIGGNTNAPTIMIAEKASDMILDDNGR